MIGATRIKERACKALVYPHVEYFSYVLDRYTETYRDKMKAVQQQAPRFVLNIGRNTSNIDDMLETLDWPTLER